MKKISLLTVILIIALVLSGCGKAPNESPNDYTDGAGGYVDDSEAKAPSLVTEETYTQIEENGLKSTAQYPTAAFSLKVDTAAYSNIARIIRSGQTPPADAVRTEEMINYFKYEGKTEKIDGPFAASAEIGPSVFDPARHIAFIRVKTDEIEKKDLPPSNLTFLIDTSGSMFSYDKLPLLKSAFALLVENLGERDTVSIVAYAGHSGILLDSASGDQKSKILDVINSLEAGGSTGGEEGIQAAYSLAKRNYLKKGNNRVILATDGDFNVGISDTERLKSFISEKRDSGIYLSVLGFGAGNLRDDMMETLSANGNGNYAYIDSVATAKKVLIDEMGANMFTVADDVKAQLAFNPETVKRYRLIGYENRVMSEEDFRDERKDAGELGAGSDVVLMVELEMADGVKKTDELFTLNLAYKDPGESQSKTIAWPVNGSAVAAKNSTDFHFATSVAAFGHLLRNSEYTGTAKFGTVLQLATDNIGADPDGCRREYIELLNEWRARK